MEGNAKKLVNTWDIVDTFFRDTEYYKYQHQIDSFNEFITRFAALSPSSHSFGFR